MSDAVRIIRRPLVTEKNMHRAEKRREYTFEVVRNANKIQIRHAVELLFNVKVLGVNTITAKGLEGRKGASVTQDSDTKKAIVKLAEGHKIDLL
ncbi:MAG: 50S ribosomal protein L23 [Planctomycetes bacterium]|nr:50S ribosomal protein L23 [Planctomycetota bacterium]